MKKHILSKALLPSLLTISSFAQGADVFWGGDVDGSFGTAGNWFSDLAHTTAGTIPGTTDVAVFNADGTINFQVASLGAARSIMGLRYNSNASIGTTITDTAALTLGTSGVTVESGSGAHTIAAPVVLGGAQTWSNASSSLFTVTGATTLGANLTLGGGGGYSFAGTFTNSLANRTVLVNGPGAVTFGNINLSESATTGRTLTLNTATDASVTGVIANGATGAGSLTKLGNGTLNLSGANTFSGTLNVNAGTVSVTTSNATNNPALSFGSATGASGTLNVGTGVTYRVAGINVLATSGGGLVTGAGSLALFNNRTFAVGDTAAAFDLQTDVPITNGDTTGRAVTKTLGGTWYINAANTFSGTLTLQGPTILNVTNTNIGGGLTFDGAVGSTPSRLTINATAQYQLPGNLTVNANAANGVVIDGAGALGIHLADRALIVNDTAATDDLLISATIQNSVNETAQNRGIRKEGLGRLVIAGNNTYTGLTDLTLGATVFEYSTNNGSKIADTAAVDFRGGGAIFNGNASAATNEIINGVVTVRTGSSVLSVVANGGQTAAVTFGAIARTAGQGLIDFQVSDANASVGTTTANGAFGFLGGYATFGGDRWAANNGSNILSGFAGTTQNDQAAWQSGQHIIADGTLSGTLKTNSIGSLILDQAAATNTVDLNNSAKTLTVESGAILVSDDVGANATSISGGSLMLVGTSATTNSAEYIFTNRSNGVLNIGASLGANILPFSGNMALTAGGNSSTGTGIVELSGRNQYSGATNIQGRVRVSGGNAIPDFSNLTIVNAGGTQLDLNNSSETVANLAGGNFTSLNGANQIVLGSGTLTVNSTASTTYGGTMIGTGNLVKQGPGTLISTNVGLALTGEVRVLGGLLDFQGNNPGVNAASLVLIRGGSLLSQQDQGASVDKLPNAAPIRLEGTVLNGLRVTSNQNGTRTESTGQLQLAAGSNVITLTNTNGTPTAAITVLAFTHASDAFVRSNNATLVARSGIADFGGTSIAQTTRVTFANGIVDTLVGGGGAAGATNISILPFAVGGVSSVTNPGDTFVTVGANGLRPLAAAEYAIAYGSALATDNLTQNASGTGLATATFNSLRIDNSAANVDITGAGGGGNSLTLTSGALLVSAGANVNDTIISGYDEILAGVSDITPDELVIHTTSSNAAPAGASLTIQSAIKDNGAAPTSLTKSGLGTLILNAANTYTGTTTINQGNLSFSTAAGLGADGPIRLAGGTLTWAPGNTTDISSKADTTARSVELIGPSIWLGIGNKIITETNTFDTGANNVTLVRPIGNGGVGSLSKSGTGTLTLSSAPAYTGPTLINAGNMAFDGGIPAGTTSALYVAPVSGTSTVTVANGLSVQSLFAGAIYAGTTNATGTVTVSSGDVVIGDGSGDDLLFIGYRDSSAGDAAAGNSVGTVNLSAATSVSINVSRIILGQTKGSGTGGVEGDLILSNGTNMLTASSILLGNSPGPGNTAVTSTISTGTGSTTIHTDALGIGGQKSQGSVVVGSGGTLTLRGLAGGSSGANLFIGVNDTSGTGTIATGLLDANLGSVDLNVNELVIGRHHSGGGGGQGQLRFVSGTVQAVDVQMGVPDFLGSSTADASTTGTITQGGGTFRFGTLSKGNGGATYTWNSGTIANISGESLTNQNVNITLATGAAHNVDIEAGQTGTFQVGSKFTGVGSLAKTGDGTLILAGANDHTGATSVDDGTLLVTGSITGSAVTVNTGATLGGNGSITNAVTVNLGGTIAPGLSPGQLDTGNFTLNTGATLSIEIGGLVAGTGYDQLNVTGSLTLGGTLSASLFGGFTPTENDIFVIALNDNLGDDSVVNTFDGIAQGGTIQVSGYEFAVDYAYNGDGGTIGNDVALIAIPEPSAILSLLGGVGVLLGLRRRRS